MTLGFVSNTSKCLTHLYLGWALPASPGSPDRTVPFDVGFMFILIATPHSTF